MSGYLVSFSLYTLAMIGVLFCALFVYKKVVVGGGCFSKKTGFLQIEETISINARKSLLVIKAGGQKFLIASDIDRTSLISQLDTNPDAKAETKVKRVDRENPNFDLPVNFDEEDNLVIDFPQKSNEQVKQPIMKELARKIRS